MNQPPTQSYAPVQQAPRKRKAGKIALLGCGGLVALVVVIIIIVIAVAASHGGSSPSAPKAAASAQLGSKVRDGKFQFVITRVTHASHAGSDPSVTGTKAQGRFTVLHVKVTNIGNEAQTLDDSAQKLLDAKGRQFSASTSADIFGNGGGSGGVFLNQINPGDSVSGKIYFDLPAGDKATSAVLHDSVFSGGVSVKL